jgi:hypothetical protein
VFFFGDFWVFWRDEVLVERRLDREWEDWGRDDGWEEGRDWGLRVEDDNAFGANY